MLASAVFLTLNLKDVRPKQTKATSETLLHR